MNLSINTLDFERRLNSRDVEAITGKHRQTLWRWINATPAKFPQPDYINGRRSWSESAIQQWLNENVKTFEEQREEA